MFERFTERARRVLVLAQDEAGLLEHGFIGTEHILLGLIHEGEGVAARVLESLGVALGPTRAMVQEIVGTVEKPTGGPSPFTPRAKKVLELSLREALALGHNYIGTEHVLLALAREGEGVAAQVLVASGAQLDEVRERVLKLLAGYVPGAASVPPAEGPAQTYAEPRCQHCRASLAGGARSRRLLVPDDDGGPPAATTVVYCGSCGRGIGAHVEPGTPPAE